MPVRRIQATQTEVNAVGDALAYFETFVPGSKVVRGLTSLFGKFSQASTPREVGLSLPTVEAALVRGAGQKYACWVAGNPSACLRQLSCVGATSAQLELVGHWLTTQDWMKGQCALPTIVKNWGGWLAKATGEALHPVSQMKDIKPAGFL